MDLLDLRNQIDQIDDELVRLFCQRMDIAAKVADYKKEQNLPIYHPGREREILQKVAKLAEAQEVNLVMTSSIAVEDVPEAVRAYIA